MYLQQSMFLGSFFILVYSIRCVIQSLGAMYTVYRIPYVVLCCVVLCLTVYIAPSHVSRVYRFAAVCIYSFCYM
jgi:hypothetical protein